MNIVHVITGLGNGGAEGVLYRLARADRANTHTVVSLMDDGLYGSRLRAVGARVHALNMPNGRVTLRGFVALWRVLREARPDVVQTWMYHADLIGGAAAFLAGNRQVVWGIRHSTLSPRESSRKTRIVARVCALVSGWLPRIIVSCSQNAAQTHAAAGYASRKMRVVPNGYDFDLCAPDPIARRRLRAEWGLRESDMLLGMVARWHPQKDHGNLARALSRLKQFAGPPFRCALVGPGMNEHNAELARLLARYGVDDVTMLLGPRHDIPAVMNALDVHVLSSIGGEGFPNVVAEAMACGTPSVATDVGDAALVVGESGWIVPAEEPRRLAEAISSALFERKRPSAWALRQQACREHVANRFDLAAMVAAYDSVWHEASGVA